jgi:porin
MFEEDTNTTPTMDLHCATDDLLMWRKVERSNGSARALGRLVSNTMLCVALGGILSVAKQIPAQLPQEQVLAGSEKREGVNWDTGKEPAASATSTSDPTDSPKGEIEATGKGETNSWAPEPTKKASLANLAPALLPYFNNGPVFGLPGTVTGNFWDRTQLSDDLGGVRSNLARHGLFFDLYSTSAYQDVASGGLKTGSALIQNTQLSINLDTGRAGLWPGGLFHLTLESREGSSSPQNTFTAGSSVPQYTGLAFPGPFFVHDVLPTEYFLLQSVASKFSVLLGKINVLTICDQTLFGNQYKFDFANFNFNKNPMAVDFYNTPSLSAVGVWTPSRKLVVAGGVFDPNSQANNLAAKAFDKINTYGTAIFSYSIGNLPGQSWAQYNWTNKPKIDLRAPFGQLQPGMDSEAIGILLGSPPIQGVPINYKSDSWLTIGNVSQYLFVKDHPEAIAGKLASGQPLRGIGVLGRLGYATEQTIPVSRDASIALFAHGLVDFRKNDSFGTGFYHNEISDPLKLDIEQLSGSKSTVRNENGSEIFYDFAITPAIRFIPSYQHIWNPLTAEVTRNQRSTDMFFARFTLVW